MTDRLTAHQLKILKLIADGHSGKASAHLLGLSPRTLEIHRARIRETLGASTTEHAVAIAFRNGLLS